METTTVKSNGHKSVEQLAKDLEMKFQTEPAVAERLANVAAPEKQLERRRARLARKDAKRAAEHTQPKAKAAGWHERTSEARAPFVNSTLDEGNEAVSANITFGGRFGVTRSGAILTNAVVHAENNEEVWIDVLVPEFVAVSLVDAKRKNARGTFDRQYGDPQAVESRFALPAGALGSFIISPMTKRGEQVTSRYNRPMYILVGGLVNSLPKAAGPDLAHGALQYKVNVSWQK